MGAVLLRVVQGNALLQVGTGRGELAKIENGIEGHENEYKRLW